MDLIPEWKDVWKMWSTWVAGALTAWNLMPESVSNIIPEYYRLGISAGLFSAFIVVRIINQPALRKGSDNDEE